MLVVRNGELSPILSEMQIRIYRAMKHLSDEEIASALSSPKPRKGEYEDLALLRSLVALDTEPVPANDL